MWGLKIEAGCKNVFRSGFSGCHDGWCRGRNKKQEELKKLYQKAREVPFGLALKLATETENEEERKFYAYIMTMNLQRKQKEAIEKNLF